MYGFTCKYYIHIVVGANSDASVIARTAIKSAPDHKRVNQERRTGGSAGFKAEDIAIEDIAAADFRPVIIRFFIFETLRRMLDDASRWRTASRFYLAALILTVLAIPWPLLGSGRSLLPF